MRCMPYVAMGATFMVDNVRAVAMDSRFCFFISTVAFGCNIVIKIIIFDVFGESESCYLERNSEVFVTIDYSQFLSPTGEYVCVFQGSSF